MSLDMKNLISFFGLDFYKHNTYDVIHCQHCAPTGETFSNAQLSRHARLVDGKTVSCIKRKIFKSRSSCSSTTPWCPPSTDDIMDELTNTLEQLGK